MAFIVGISVQASSTVIKEKVTALFEKVCGAFAKEGEAEDKQFTSKQIIKKIKGVFRKELKDMK